MKTGIAAAERGGTTGKRSEPHARSETTRSAATGASSSLAPGPSPSALALALSMAGSPPSTPPRVDVASEGEPGSSWMGPGLALGDATAAMSRSRVSGEIGAARLHRDPAAGAVARALEAEAVTVGRDVYFGVGSPRPGTPAGDRLLRHELAHVAQSPPDATARVDRVAAPDAALERAAHEVAASRPAAALRAPRGTALRIPLVRTTSQRWTEAEILAGGRVPATSGGGSTGPMTLGDFADWSDAQPDWPSGLSEALRADLWQLRSLLVEGPHIRAGLRALTVASLRPELANAAHMAALRAYSRGFVETEDTVGLTTPTAVVATAIDLGEKMAWLVANVGGAALREAMPESDFLFYAASPVVWANLQDYVTHFHPFIESADRNPVPDPRSDNARLRRLVTDPLGIPPLYPLIGRIRNLHRFPRALLNDQLRLWATRGTMVPPVTLVLQGGHDWGNAFARTDEELLPPMAVPAEVRFRLLVYEGPETLAAATGVINSLRADYGAVRDVIIVGHGESRRIGMAGAGPPTRGGGYTRYPEEELNLGPAAPSTPATEAFFDALLGAMDPASARVVFAGCLVGTTSVPQQVRDPITNVVRPPTDAEIRAYYADPNSISMAEWLTRRPAATGRVGFAPGFVAGARADTAAPAGLINPGTGRAEIQYPADPAAFRTANEYILDGHEPTGLMRAVRELMVRNLPLARASLTTRVGRGAPLAPMLWWDDMATQMAAMALPAVIANDLPRIHRLEAIAGAAFLSFFNPRGYKDQLAVLSAADAATLFPAMLAAGPPGDARTRPMRIVVRQSWAIIDNARAADYMAELDASAPLLASHLVRIVDHVRIAPMLAALLPVPPPVAPSRGQLLLSLILTMDHPARATAPAAGDPQPLQFLHPLAAPTRALPPAALPLIAGFADEAAILERLGLGAAGALVPVGPPPVGPVSLANVRTGLPSDATNRLRIEPPAYTATVVVFAANVRNRPSTAGTIMRGFTKGTVVHVLGWSGDWAAVEYSVPWRGNVGALGYVYRSNLSPP